MAKLFRITVVILAVAVSLAFIVVLLPGVASILPFPTIAHTDGITAVSGGFSDKLLRAALLILILCYLLWSWRRGSRGRKSR